MLYKPVNTAFCKGGCLHVYGPWAIHSQVHVNKICRPMNHDTYLYTPTHTQMNKEIDLLCVGI